VESGSCLDKGTGGSAEIFACRAKKSGSVEGDRGVFCLALCSSITVNVRRMWGMECWRDVPGLFTLESNHVLNNVIGDGCSIGLVFCVPCS
jgi:hypothetical protein